MKRALSSPRIAGLVLTGLTALALMGSTAFGSDPHAFTGLGCNTCHTDIARETSTGTINLIAGVDARCAKCHSSCAPGRKHSGKKGQWKNMKVDLPFDRQGRMACFTCHDPHLDAMEGKNGVKTTYLRINNLERELCMNCHRTGAAQESVLKVIYPPTRAAFSGQALPLLGTALGIPDGLVTVKLNDIPFSVQAKDGTFYTRLKLQEGLNKIEVSAIDGTPWRSEIFSFEGNGAGVSYQVLVNAHGTESRQGCAECHKGAPGGPPTASSRMLCQHCHATVGTMKFIHGPAAVGECLVCHDPHGGFGAAALKADGDSLCLGCHPRRMMGKHETPTGVPAADCLGCHDPHQSDTWYLGRGSSVIKSSLTERSVKQP